jgi:hypothetical protein
MELICGACQGRLLAEVPGSTVACPHCGTHLQTPAIESAVPTEATILFDSAEGDAAEAPNPDKDTVRMDFWVPPAEPESVGLAEGFGPDRTRPGAPTDQNIAAAFISGAAIDGPEPEGAIPGVVLSESGTNEGDDTDDPNKTTVMGFVVDPGAGTDPDAGALKPDSSQSNGAVSPGVAATPPESFTEPDSAEFHVSIDGASEARPAHEVSSATSSAVGVGVAIGVATTTFVALLSYASAVTLGCLYLAYLLWQNPRTLDLPDLAPPVSKDKRKTTSLIYLPPEKEIPPANILKLRESRQYGSVMVTPMRVTRGPVEFVYDDPTGGQSSEQRDPEGPVLKLHLRFENVSKDQEFVPLDRRLVYTKELDRKSYGLFKTNNFVSNVSGRGQLANHVLVFDQSPDSSWLMKEQNLDHDLGPGQVLNTYIATTPEQIETLEGDLVWRVHFRKGYNPKSLRGVTTLIEVLFRSSDIVDDERQTNPSAEDQQPADEKPREESEPGHEKNPVKDV